MYGRNNNESNMIDKGLDPGGGKVKAPIPKVSSRPRKGLGRGEGKFDHPKRTSLRTRDQKR